MKKSVISIFIIAITITACNKWYDKPSCQNLPASLGHSFVKYNRDLNKLLLRVSEYYDANVEKNTVWMRSNIVMMNLDGSNEERLPITIP